MSAISDSIFGPADAISNAFNFLNGYNHSEPNAVDGAQNEVLSLTYSRHTIGNEYWRCISKLDCLRS